MCLELTFSLSKILEEVLHYYKLLVLISTEEAGFGVKFCFFSAGSESVKTLKRLTVRRGGSLTVPCLYEEEYKSHRKYWCKGGTWSSCTIVAKTNTRNTGISITDHPSQNMFTVDLKKLQDSDSGWYWCALEIDVSTTHSLLLHSDPAVWVENSRVIGQEGGGVSVQGNYSSGYKNEEKKWCRFKDWSCYTFQDSTVKISDDENRGSFRVEMIGLQESDAGWYWISAGGVAVTVHLTVTERPTSKMILISRKNEERTQNSKCLISDEPSFQTEPPISSNSSCEAVLCMCVIYTEGTVQTKR
uniref:Ig-like domain-containing protein n=1 Tax=Astyanax mexicanus TaxID=7994 RepID=A0A3B1JPT0_ASTMX